MIRFRLARRGTQGQLHACVLEGRVLVPACGRRLPADVTVWKSARMIDALWNADDARRCLDCSRKTGAARSTRAARRIR